MEANKEEAERCIEAAERAVNSGQREKAARLLRKAENMYPTEKAQCELIHRPPTRKQSYVCNVHLFMNHYVLAFVTTTSLQPWKIHGFL